ncbi:MAG: nucleotide exchange factor GrpE [Tannerella sp.]|jgi:molecular chaperone GrpE|nr:nucleotide exchange factor GrpE [Tannerella sp.]
MPDNEIIETSNQTQGTTSDSAFRTPANEKQRAAGANADATDLQTETELKSEKTEEADNLSADANFADNAKKTETAEERYAALNDSHLRLMADFDNFRKRTVREKAELIKSGGASVLTNLLPVVDDFERALSILQNTEELGAAVEGVKLIYDKFIAFLTQQGVKAIDAVGQPFDTEMAEAIAMVPVAEEDKKGKVIDCVQTGYTLYDKVLRHARVVVGE